MASPGNATIIIRRVKKSYHTPHHSGAWKVAYADFVTAMMAFFLLLWLLNATTEDQKRGIADYFTPSSLSKSNSGGGGVLAGRSLGKKGVRQSDRSAINVTIAIPAPPEPTSESESEEHERTSDPSVSPQELEQQRLDEMLARREEEQFAVAEQALRQAIESVPELKELAENLIVDQTPEGMRIQIVDQEKYAMFPLGSAEMFDHTQKLITLVVDAIGQLPNQIAIKGHTDARPFVTDHGYSNWELSTDRANASRRALVDAGLPPERIASVVGRAAQEPLIPEDPNSPQNRRISIILMREAGSGATRQAPAPAPVATPGKPG